MDKLRLNFLFGAGGCVALNDAMDHKMNCAFTLRHDNIDQFKDLNTLELNGNYFVTSFAPRKNKGVQPVPDNFPVKVTLLNGECQSRNASHFNWIKNLGDRAISTWKPDLKALLKVQSQQKKPPSTNPTKKEKNKNPHELKLNYLLIRSGTLDVGDRISHKTCSKVDIVRNVEYCQRLNKLKDSGVLISGFSFRLNKGSVPVPDNFPVIVKTSRGEYMYKPAGDMDLFWSLNCDVRIEKWKPDINRLIEMQNHDKAKNISKGNGVEIELIDKNTQEELSEFTTHQKVYISGENDRDWLFGCYLPENKELCIVFSGSAHMIMPVSRLSRKQIKTQQDIEQELKCKQIDSFLETYKDIVEFHQLNELLNIMQDNGDLAKIISPLEPFGDNDAK